MKNKKLGKGLSELIGGGNLNISTTSELGAYIPVTQMYPGQFQPRTNFNDEALAELSASIRARGVIQPIIVRQQSNGYEIIAGERRWRASKMAGLIEVPVIICDIDDKQCLEFSLIENIQRKDLNPIEEAKAYKKLIDIHLYTHEELAEIVGKSRSHISNLLRLLALPNAVQNMIETEKLTQGHARAIICARNQEHVANEIIKKNLSVRQAEKLAKSYKSDIDPNDAKKTSEEFGDIDKEDLIFLEKLVSKELGFDVKLLEHNGSGKILVAFKNISELKTILRKFGIEVP